MSLIGAVAATVGAGAVVSFAVNAVSDFQLFPGEAAVSVTFGSDGTYSGSGNIEGFSGNWITPTAAAGDAYEIRLTVNSGTTPSGSAPNIWLGLGTLRQWSLQQSGVGDTASNVTIEIRRASTGVVLSDGGGPFDITATVSS